MSKIFILFATVLLFLPNNTYAQSCWSDNDCPSGKPTCSGYTLPGPELPFGAQGQCAVATKAPIGSPCNTPAQCESGVCSANLQCVQGQTQQAGQECTIDANCQSGLVCQKLPSGKGACFKALPLGAACKENKDCQSGSCEKSICVSSEEKYVPPIEPKLQIPIPGLKLTTLFTPVQEGEQRVLYIPTIAEYAAGLYKYLIGIAGILAGIMIVWAGVKWLMAAGNAEMISDAKHKIGGAIIGIILAVGSYVILYLINPDLVTFKSLRIPLIAKEEFEFVIDSGNDEGGSVDGVSAACASEADTVSVANALQQQGKTGLVSLGSPQARLHKDVINALIKAGELAKTNNKTLYITPHGALRTLETQQKIFNKAVAKWGSEETAHKYAAKPSCSAPHTTGRAMDVCFISGSDICSKLNSSFAALKTPDIVLLQNIMQQAGFKRYCAEWWHFEYNLAGSNRCSP